MKTDQFYTVKTLAERERLYRAIISALENGERVEGATSGARHSPPR